MGDDPPVSILCVATFVKFGLPENTSEYSCNMARECSSRRVSVAPSPAPVPGAASPVSAADEDDQDYVYFSASESDAVSDEEEAVDACSGDEEVLKSAAPDREVASRTRKRALSESFLESIVSAESSVDLVGQSALAGSQPSLSSGPAVSRPPRKKKFVDLPSSGFTSQQVADALTRPYRGILPRTSYAYVSPDAVKPDVPVVMDFGYLTRAVVADDCTFELDRFVKYVHRKFSRVVASPNFASNVAVSAESLPAATPAKFPGQ